MTIITRITTEHTMTRNGGDDLGDEENEKETQFASSPESTT